MTRGALIVLEGMDKTGKTTQCKMLQEKIPNSVLMNFPNRSTAIGQIINQYLKKEIELSDEAVHLLFSSNRWEAEENIKKLLNSGTSIIIDRYAFSGIAFSSAKSSLLESNGGDLDRTLHWCKQPDIGLPKPDLTFYLTLNSSLDKSEILKNRGDFGAERYEKTDFQVMFA